MRPAISDIDLDAKAPPSRRLAARRAAFLAAARDVFQQKGFAEATLDDIIALSGGSRQTLYALFGGKQGLFEALVTETCWSIFGGLAHEALAAQAPELVLTEVGVRYLEIVLSAETLNLTRLVVAEASRFPEIGETYWKRGPGRSRDLLAEYFEREAQRGTLRLADARTGADHFLEMLSGTIRFQCLTGVRQPPDGAEIRAIVAAAVARFLNGCAREAPLPR